MAIRAPQIWRSELCRPTVLIVDDSKLARIVAGRALAALRPRWTKREVGSAEQAFEILANEPVDVALIDFNMPGKDGLQLAADMRARWPAMPIAIITANIQDDVIARARVGRCVRDKAGDDRRT